MKFRIVHDTEYLYESDVFLEPHYLRFRPRTSAYLKRESFDLTVDAPPTGRREIQDEEGNVIEFCWFSGTTQRLAIRAQSVIETRPYNPLDFILYPARFNDLPVKYSNGQADRLYPFLQQLELPAALLDYGEELQAGASFSTVQYLLGLTNQIHTDFAVVYREVGAPLTARDTFDGREGSCRDLSWMMIALLRAQGFAARFTSGYFYFEMDEAAYELHAWVEVFLPGSGWLGLDPSHGIAAGNTHFPICSSSYHANTMPVSGGIRGSAGATLTATLSIEAV